MAVETSDGCERTTYINQCQTVNTVRRCENEKNSLLDVSCQPKFNVQTDNRRLKDGNSSFNEDGYYDDLDRGWAWMVLLASFATYCIIGSATFSVGITHIILLEKYNKSVVVTSWASALHSVLNTLGAPASSALIDRYNCRVTMVIGGLCYVVGFLLTAVAPTIEIAIFTCGILAGMGGALAYTASMVAIRFNFQRHRNLALGISSAGVGFGMFVLAPVMQIARDFYGTFGFFIIMAAITANVITFGMMCFPSQLEMEAKRKRVLEAANKPKLLCSSLIPYKTVFLNKGILILCLAMTPYLLNQYLVLIFLPSYAVSKGLTPMEASFLISLAGITNILGRITTGIVANFKRVSTMAIYCGSMFIVALITMAYPALSELSAGHIGFTTVFGLFNGSVFVVMANVTLKFVGIEHLAVAVGLQLGFGGVGGLIGPSAAGLLFDTIGSYDVPLLISGACALVSCLLGLLSLCFIDKNRSRYPTDAEVTVDT